jgi:Galactose mutarotase and related enzymes
MKIFILLNKILITEPLMRYILSKRRIVISFLVFYIPSLLNARDSTRYTIEKSSLKDCTQIIILHDNVAGIEAVVVPSQGGELSSLRIRFHGQWHELLYKALEYKTTGGWRGKAPLLWPAVGRNFAQGADKKANNFSYDFNGKQYEIPIHGFVRFKTWQIANMRANNNGAEVELILTDDEESRKQYPFGFEFHAIHRITKGHYEVSYKISSSRNNQLPMFFSIGNHITFRVPFVEESSLKNFYFETPLNTQYLLDENSIPTGKTQLNYFTPAVAITSFKKNDAVSLGGFSGDPWIKLTDPAGIAIIVRSCTKKIPDSPFVQFNLWGSAADGYFSPEPWIGFQNSLNSHQGLIYVSSGKSWKWNIKVEIERNE